MRKALYILGSTILVFLGLIIGLYFFFEAKVKREILPTVKKTIKEQSKLNIEFSGIHFSLTELLKLEPSIKISDLKIEEAVFIKKIYIRVYLKALLKKKFDIKEIVIDKALIKLEENARKEASLKGIKFPKQEKQIETNKVDPLKDLISEIKLESLTIKNSKIEYYIYKAPKPMIFYNIKASLDDLNLVKENTKQAKFKFFANMFGSHSYIKGNGRLGPIGFDLASMPISGSENLVIMLKDMNAIELKKVLGPLAKINPSTKITQSVNFSGNLLKGISGSGILESKNLILGNSEAHTITVNSKIPHSFYMTMSGQPNLSFSTKNSHIEFISKKSQVGKLDFNLKLNQNPITGYTTGHSEGQVSGLDIEEMLNCFTPHRKLISGVFEVSHYDLSFAGSNIKTNGHMVIRNGSLYILKSITKYNDIANALITNGGAMTEKLSGTFADLSTDFDYDGATLINDNIKLSAGKLSLIGNGLMMKDQSLNYDFRLIMSKLNSIPIKVRGTIAKPIIKADLKQFSKEQGKKASSTALQYGLLALKQVASGNGAQAKTTVNTALKQIGKTLATNGSLINNNGKSLTINKQGLKQLGGLLQNTLQTKIQTQIGTKTQSTNGSSASSSSPQLP